MPRVRFPRRCQRRDLLQLRSMETIALGPVASGTTAGSGPGLRPVHHGGQHRPLRRNARRVGVQYRHGWHRIAARTEPRDAVPLRRKRCDPGFRLRPLVDDLQRRLAAWRPAAHLLQPDVGSAARAGDSGVVRAGPHRHHLHRFPVRPDSRSALSWATCFRACHSSAAPGLTVGASAPIFGLLGAQVCYGRRTGSSHIGGTAWQYAVVLFLFGLIMHGVDNWAHAGGFAGGYAAALLLDPSKARASGSPDRRAGRASPPRWRACWR